MIEQKHECPEGTTRFGNKPGGYVFIYRKPSDGTWWMNLETRDDEPFDLHQITFCPYCGEKLP